MPTAFEKYEHSEFGGVLSPCFEHVRDLLTTKKVLDIASGDGTYLKQFGKGSVGIDISDPNLILCKKLSLNVLKGDLNKRFPFRDNSFDAIFCSNILEHVDSPIFMLRECNRILHDNGTLILVVPNEDSFIHWFYDYFESNGRHLYSFSVNNLHALFRETDFTIMKIFGDFHTVLSRKLKLTFVLEQLHRIPLKLTDKLSHFYWVIAKKN